MSNSTILKGIRSSHARAYIDLVDAIEAHERASIWVDRAAGKFERLSQRLAEHVSMREIRLREPIAIILDLAPDANTLPEHIIEVGQ